MDVSLIAGLPPRGVASVLACLLQDRAGPLTPLLEGLAGREPGSLAFTPSGPPARRDLTAAQSARLDTGLLEPCWHREGTCGWPGLAATRCSLTWLEDRIPATAHRMLLRGTVPLGTLLAGHLARADRRALALPGPYVTCSAVMAYAGRPAAIAAEEITPEYLRAVADAREPGRSWRRMPGGYPSALAGRPGPIPSRHCPGHPW
jgi:hypothetical protein